MFMLLIVYIDYYIIHSFYYFYTAKLFYMNIYIDILLPCGEKGGERYFF